MTLSSEDSLSILQLVACADNCATARDADGYAALFTRDASMDGAMGTAEGRAAIHTNVVQVWGREPSDTVHLTLNAVIDVSAEQPSVGSVLLLLQNEQPPKLLGLARITQTFEREDGAWKIASRRICVTPSA